MATICKIPIDSLARAYFKGVVFAGYHFCCVNPDWYLKLDKGLFYAATWPYTAYKTITSIIL